MGLEMFKLSFGELVGSVFMVRIVSPTTTNQSLPDRMIIHGRLDVSHLKNSSKIEYDRTEIRLNSIVFNILGGGAISVSDGTSQPEA